MKRLRHESIAHLALDRGFIDDATCDHLLGLIRQHGDGIEDVSVEEFWIGGGWLRREQLDELEARVPTRPQVTGSRAVGDPVRPGGTVRYEMNERIGTGGMGHVYEAVDRHLDRRVAMKVPHPGAAESVVALLAREARVAGSLEHPAIVPVYDAGAEDGIGPYYTMRLLEQPTLEEVIVQLAEDLPGARHHYSLGRLLRYYVQICQAVDYAHNRGIVHCDLKPANVVVGDFGEVVILDWGMAFKLEEGLHNRGGTPGYMAPEQMKPDAAVDIRADIFALGAMLYEIICLQPAYGRGVTMEMLRVAHGQAALVPPPPPRTRRADVPEELEQICMRAMSMEPSARQATARELANDIESFLEGTRERERRLARAAELVAQGDQLAEMYGEYVESRPRVVAELTRIRAATATWDPAESKRDLWDAEDRLVATDAVGVRTFQAAAAAYEQAIEEVAGYPAARRGLAALYATEVKRARQRRDEINRIYFEELVKQYADGSPSAPSRSDGLLRVTCGAAGAGVVASEYEEQDRRLIPVRSRPLGPAPLETRLPSGVYLLQVNGAGEAPAIRFPVAIAPDGEVSIEIDGDALRSLPPGEVYVPGGAALLGGDDLSPWGRELQLVHVEPFIIAERPVAFAEYLAFVEVLARRGEDIACYLPVNALGVPHWRWNGEAFVLAANFNFERDELLALPAVGVSLASAEAYAAWRLLKTGRTYRLPREDEWEKAARGVDGRSYPWGDHFDASFCKMYQSRPGPPRPERSGAFPADVSPYGVLDMAGGVADWVVSQGQSRENVSRGGAWCDWRVDCSTAARRPYQPGARTSRVGFRLARDP